MITLYQTDDMLYLHQDDSEIVYQLPSGTPFADIGKAVQSVLLDETEKMQFVLLQDIRSVLNHWSTEPVYDIDNEVVFLRAHIEQLESELRLARLPHPMQSLAMKQLHPVLDELEKMEPLAPIGSGHDHGAWMTQCERINELCDLAKRYALWVITDEVQSLYDKIQKQHSILCANLLKVTK